MTGKNDAVNESLSALIDGEHNELDLRRVLKAAETDESVLQNWASYHAQAQVHNKEIDSLCDESFLQGIRDALADDQAASEASDAGKQAVRQSSWRGFAAKGALAACFTFAFLIGASQLQLGADGVPAADLAAANSSSSGAVVPNGFELPPLTARTVSSLPATRPEVLLPRSKPAVAVNPSEFVLSAEMQEQLHRMIKLHAEQTSANGGLGVLPFSRVNPREER